MRFRNVFGKKSTDASERNRVALKLNRFNEFMRRNSIWILIIIAMVLTIIDTRNDSHRARVNTEKLKADNAEQTRILKEQTEQLKEGNERLKEIEHQNNCLLRIHIQGDGDVSDCGPVPMDTSPTPTPQASRGTDEGNSSSENKNNANKNGGGANNPPEEPEDFDVPIVPEMLENIVGL